MSGGVETVTDNKLYRWAGLEEIGEYEAGSPSWWDVGTKTRSYLPGLAEVSGSDQATGAYRHYLNDHLGTPRRILDGAKATLAKHSYTPYGEPLSNAGLPIHVGYTGHTWDSVTSQWFAPYRYYNPSAARWGWRDPLGFVDGPNTFAYVGASPLRYVDSQGLFIETAWDVANLGYNLCKGNWLDAGADVVSILVPGLPAGWSKLRHLNKFDDYFGITNKTFKRRYIKKHGEWPHDKDGRPYDVHHEKPLADGGTRTEDNMRPKPHDEHIDDHKKNGDFKRWGKRPKKGPCGF